MAMEEHKKKKKLSNSDIGELQRSETFLLGPSAKAEKLDTSHWPLLLKHTWLHKSSNVSLETGLGSDYACSWAGRIFKAEKEAIEEAVNILTNSTPNSNIVILTDAKQNYTVSAGSSLHSINPAQNSST
ncbi:H/ACA ribonucleoprotein complex subunit dkc1 [Bulinus truncatus]|nr:H/ACA ribonucleoprotein complex subunit dkc1 [Bulinus truncatus]